jgi:CheY-like chemotaxis protein
MTRVAWIGPPYSGQRFRSAVMSPGLEVMELDGVESALSTFAGAPPEVAVIVVDSEEGSGALPVLRDSWPATQLLAATRLGVPPHVAGALGAGATDLVDLRAPDGAGVAEQVRRAVERYARASQERELLVRVRTLNEGFLKNFVDLEKRNIELETKLGKAQPPAAADDRCRVLVVDDEPAIRKIFELILSPDYPLSSVESAEKALEVFRRQPFPLVITDKNLPGMDGLELARQLKKLSPDTEVVLITGYGSKEAAIEAVSSGVSLFLEKPFDDLTDVTRKLEGVVAKWREGQGKQRVLHTIKTRNREFLDQYRVIRADLDNCLRRAGAANG